MTDQKEKAEIFQALHVKGDPVVLYNIWDPGSAKAVVDAGAKALALGSWPVAASQNYGDGEKIPMSMSVYNAKNIVGHFPDVPLTLDFEGAYSVEPEGVEENFSKALESGVVGFNFEDQIVGGEGLHAVDAQSKRVSAARKAIDASGVNAYLNARTDIFLKAKPDTHDETMLADAIDRANAYKDAGASGFFAPGLVDETMIAKLVEAVDIPLNIIALPGCPPKATLAQLGVARISYGPVPYRKMMAALTQAAKEAFA